ncbi:MULTISPECIES: murein hydrolase activator EnvC family protein [unclassified Knoellia]|uniref:murein hydrolase activator EnvC family protein n=1 Tax=Knoellia altitudinis TaxID=3404795 RepID=UPI00360A826C
MSPTPAIRPLLVALTLVGSLVPGVVLGPDAPVSPPEAGAVTGPVRVPGPDPDSLRRTWSWPVSPRPAVLAAFVAPRSTYGAGHRGIDLAAKQGQQVQAVDEGVVSHVGVIAGRGTVSITHASGLRSTYEPVRGAVSTGARVSAGQLIGTVAGRSHCGGACLHLGALVGSAYLDPRPLLGGGPVILLPLAVGS